MPVVIEWYNEAKTILYEKLSGKITLEEYHHLVDDAAQELNQQPHTVHIIADFSEASILPTNLVAAMRYANKRMPSNQGIVVFINPNMLIKQYIQVAKNLHLNVSKTLFAARTEDEATQIIQQELKREKL